MGPPAVGWVPVFALGAGKAVTLGLSCPRPRPPFSGSESGRNDVKTEPGAFLFAPPFGVSPNGPRPGLISVAITLHPAAAEVQLLWALAARSHRCGRRHSCAVGSWRGRGRRQARSRSRCRRAGCSERRERALDGPRLSPGRGPDGAGAPELWSEAACRAL